MPPGLVCHVTGILIWSEFRTRQRHLHFVQKSPWTVPPAVLQEEKRWQCGFEIWVPIASYCKSYLQKGNGMLYRMGILLTQTIESDTPGFYSFGKWWLQKRHFFFWHYWDIERQSRRGNQWNRQIKHTLSKSYMWCSLETGILSCINSEMLLSSFLEAQNIFTKGETLCGIIFFLSTWH
jgi:hypothetical protein